MESFFSRFKNALVLIAILLVQTIALATQINRAADPSRPDGPKVRLLRLWAIAMIAPFERLSNGIGGGIHHAWSNYVDLRHVRQQNLDLQKQLDELRLQRAALTQDALEGQRLRTLLDFRQSYAASTVAAQIIGSSGSDQSRLLTLNKGSHDGLKPDMAVITPTGIVGKLRDVFPYTSQLLLINDQTAGAGVILGSTRIHAILRGSSVGRLQITNLTPDSRIKPGENVLTSGGDGVFPRGLPVGVIESIILDPEHQPYTLITVRPALDLNQLDEVLVVTGTGAMEALNQTQEQMDLAADPLAHAADISAERLPSLHDDKPAEKPADGTAAPTPAPDTLNDAIPKPKPTVHADRYSPGAAPPATDLTPGAPKSKN